MTPVSEGRLRRAAEACAAELNLLEPAAFPEWLAEFAILSPHWDDRTNLYSLVGDNPEGAAVVLKCSDGFGDDYLLVRWIGHWVVDADPVDWETMEEARLALDGD